MILSWLPKQLWEKYVSHLQDTNKDDFKLLVLKTEGRCEFDKYMQKLNTYSSRICSELY